MDKVWNEEVLRRVGEKKTLIETARIRKRNWMGHWLRRDSLLVSAVEGMVNGRKGRIRWWMRSKQTNADEKGIQQNEEQQKKLNGKKNNSQDEESAESSEILTAFLKRRKDSESLT
ncbi:hypothetical protein J437_LFUL012064 [Ladona fulva]|uniref:Uncharacterized protein n=1 Tax=Ladona fulva TaxID=123851 RepID=A0A8K0P5W7_LADFU|nr:hypothetical protein J437_LFUL012064 [Ladona fulva]